MPQYPLGRRGGAEGSSGSGSSSSSSKRASSSTTKLPATLRDELGLEDGNPRKSTSETRRARAELFRNISKGSGRHTALNRKEARKNKRHGIKEARARHYSSHVNAEQEGGKGHKISKENRYTTIHAGANQTHVNGHVNGKGKQKQSSTASVLDEQTQNEERQAYQTQTPLQRMLAQQSTSTGNLAGPSMSTVSSHKRKNEAKDVHLSSAERNEEDEIAWLEAHLGGRNKATKADIGPRKRVKKLDLGSDDIEEGDFGQDDDGLDDLLGDLDRFYPGMYDDEESDEQTAQHSSATSEESSWVDDSPESDQSAYEENLSELSEANEELDNDLASHETPRDGIDESRSAIGSNIEYDESNINATKGQENGASGASSKAEQVKTPARYIPPALRANQAQLADGPSAEEQKCRRQAKGLLNRLGEGNIDNIVNELEKLFQQFSRAIATSSIVTLIIESVLQNDSISDVLVVTYASLAASLHRIIGVEFGARFIEVLTEDLMKVLRNVQDDHTNDRDSAKEEARSLSSLLSAAYSIGIVACPLIYDIIKLIIGFDVANSNDAERQMTESDMDLLLRMVKMCGSQLRHDDASSLKIMVQLAKRQLEGNSSSRALFMLDSLQDLSNSRSRATAPNVAQEQLSKMRKYIGSLGKRRTLRTHEPLRVSLRDLQDAKSRGKWWLVGAAWAGYDLQDGAKGDDSFPSPQRKRPKKDDGEDQSETFLALAKEHGMNTTLRQQIFVILLNSQDYLDAVQRLLGLTHRKSSQRREIVRVLLHCLGREPTFNPYYVIVGERLASEDTTGTRITMQYCLWDYLRQLGEKSVGGRSILAREEDEVVNDNGEDPSFGVVIEEQKAAQTSSIARAFGWWIAKDALGLEALRPVDFTSLRKRGLQFLQLLIIHILLGAQSSSPAEMLTLPSAKPRKGEKWSFEDKAKLGETIPLSAPARGNIEKLFVQGTRANQHIAQGLVVFFERSLRPKECVRLAKNVLGASENTTQHLLAGREIAFETICVGAQVAARDVDTYDSNYLPQ